MFPTLTPLCPVIRRGGTEVQLGVDPAEAVVMSGLSEAEILLLEHLDGSMPMAEISARSDRVASVVGDLVSRGLVVDAHAGRPHRGRVVVCGHEPTAEVLAQLFAAAGVRCCRGPEALGDLDVALRGGAVPTVQAADLVVLAAEGAVAPEDRLLPAGVPVLPVILNRETVQVGPIVDGTGPCLSCLDLTRADLDPAWAHVLAQTTTRHGRHRALPSTFLAAGLAVSTALAHLAEPGVAAPTSVTMAMGPTRVTERRWSIHPRCGRHGEAHRLRPAPEPRADR